MTQDSESPVPPLELLTAAIFLWGRDWRTAYDRPPVEDFFPYALVLCWKVRTFLREQAATKLP